MGPVCCFCVGFGVWFCLSVFSFGISFGSVFVLCTPWMRRGRYYPRHSFFLFFFSLPTSWVPAPAVFLSLVLTSRQDGIAKDPAKAEEAK